MTLVDAHVHFWDPGVLQYPWLDDVPALRRAFLPRDYPGDANAMVFVEANCQGAGEIDFVERLAAVEPRIAGIVAYVDMLDEPVNALVRMADRPLLVGIRHNIQGTPPGFCRDPRFVRGVKAVGRRGYPFDLCATADQLDDVAALVERCPETTFVLDHCGKPAIRRDAFDAWANALERIARFSNVSCKLSGLLTEARPEQRDARSLRPYVEQVCGCFGAERVLYGSDWPVLTLAGDVSLWRSIVETLTSRWTMEDRQRLFADNAVGLYRLTLHA